mgnify:CR=1 FL=1
MDETRIVGGGPAELDEKDLDAIAGGEGSQPARGNPAAYGASIGLEAAASLPPARIGSPLDPSLTLY